MSNRVMTAAVAAATASLLLGGGIVRAAAPDLDPQPAVASAVQAVQPPEPATLVPVPVTVADPGTVTAPVTTIAPSTHVRHLIPGSGRHSTPQDVVVTPAPPSQASASVLQINPLDTCVSCTHAGAGSGTADAEAVAIRLLGNNISAGKSSSGQNSGALLAIPASPLLFLAVADWATSASPGATSTSHSRAALVDLIIGPSATSHQASNGHAGGGVISLAIFEATSDAAYQGSSSNGTGANNGVDLNIGNGALVILILHSDASGTSPGSAYVLGINGTKILGSDNTGPGGIPVTVPGVVGLILLQVTGSGGNGSTGNPAGNGASVGTVGDLLGQSGQTAGVLTASAVGLPGTGAPSAGTATAAPNTGGGALTAPNAGVGLGLAAALLLPAGLLLLFASLRRRANGAG
ncbi:MAG TPA: hypothetical protein VH134_11610 [Candidatus Dormibacteraeota bacterium]|jgi:hypothetical protein|nr:hypothetical protein [Candidatus Dormibacteraeota bacterium]